MNWEIAKALFSPSAINCFLTVYILVLYFRCGTTKRVETDRKGWRIETETLLLGLVVAYHLFYISTYVEIKYTIFGVEIFKPFSFPGRKNSEMKAQLKRGENSKERGKRKKMGKTKGEGRTERSLKQENRLGEGNTKRWRKRKDREQLSWEKDGKTGGEERENLNFGKTKGEGSAKRAKQREELSITERGKRKEGGKENRWEIIEGELRALSGES